MIARLRSERGTVLATTMILMGLMTAGGLATYAYVDGQTRESGTQRVRETSFNVGEGLLGAQVFILSRDWPLQAAQPYPDNCSTGVVHDRCPDGAALVSAFGGPDVAKGVNWSTRVLDNKLDDSRLTSLPADETARCNAASRATPSYYDDAAMVTQAPLVSYDRNRDCRMWVRAQAAIDGRRRTFVGLVRVEQMVEQFPQNVITAGKFATGNSGNKRLVDTKGSAAQASAVALRCSASGGKNCIDVGKEGQIDPPNISYDYPSSTALTPDALARLRERAKSLGTYHATFTGCSQALSGPLVFIETGTISCTGNHQFNTPEAPGTLIVATGTANFSGTTVFHGIIHMANLQNSSGWVLTTGGTGLIHGAVSVDGPGGVYTDASGDNIVYDPGVFSRLVSFGNAGIIQNTWREIVPAPGT